MTITRFYRTIFIIAITLLLQQAGLAQSNAEQDYQRSIKEVGSKISSITRNLNNSKAELKTERHKLFETEQKLSQLSKELEQTEQQIQSQQDRLNDLTKSLETTLVSQAKNRDALEALILNRYKQGSQNYLKLLLNQQNPYAVWRLNNYHSYFSSALREKFSILQKQATEIGLLRAKQSTALEALSGKKETQDDQKNKLKATKKARAKSVAALKMAVSEDSKKLKQLNKDRARLDSLLKQIAIQKAELERLEKARKAQELAERAAKPPSRTPTTKAPHSRPARTPVKGGFAKQKGRLSYPVSAKRKRRFGSRLAESGMTSDGVFFETPKNEPVKSIFRGQVLFADFLKGYGLLLIIDHGDDHISLYGHNEILYKKVGDAVDTNEVVAKTGVTGGLKSPGLYFEIRNKATPVNPAKWCQ